MDQELITPQAAEALVSAARRNGNALTYREIVELPFDTRAMIIGWVLQGDVSLVAQRVRHFELEPQPGADQPAKTYGPNAVQPIRVPNPNDVQVVSRDEPCREMTSEDWTLIADARADQSSLWDRAEMVVPVRSWHPGTCVVYSGIRFRQEELLRAMDFAGFPVPRVSPAESAATTSDIQPKPTAIEQNKGGRPPVYDWERAVAAIVFQWADEGSWQPASQADVKNKLAAWFSQRNEHPADSSLKTRAKWLFEEFQGRSGEVENPAA